MIHGSLKFFLKKIRKYVYKKWKISFQLRPQLKESDTFFFGSAFFKHKWRNNSLESGWIYLNLLFILKQICP